MDLCRRAHDEGHWIGNHSWTHATPLGELNDAGSAEREIGRTQRELESVAHPHRWFLPFGGGNLDQRLLSPDALAYLQAGRFSFVLWNAVSGDWANPDGWVDAALAQCASQPWTLIVLHDLPTGAMRLLPRFLDSVRERGGRFRQDFPPECEPIREGRIVRPVDKYVARAE